MITFSTKHTPDEIEAIKVVLEPILPIDEYNILVLEFSNVKRSSIVGEDKFFVKFRTNVRTKDQVKDFIQSLSDKSGTTYNSLRGDKTGNGSKVVLSGTRKCQHFVRRHHLKPDGTPNHPGPGRQPRAERQAGKDTQCPAKLSFSLSGEKLHISKKSSTIRQHLSEYPLEVKLDYHHNHSINSANALKYRPISEQCKSEFIALFEKDLSPSSAFAQYKDSLLADKSSFEAMEVMADRSRVPDYFWVFHFHKKYIETTYGPQTGPDAYKLAKEKISRYNERHGQTLAKIETTESGDVIIAICDEFNRRVHEHVPQSGDIVLVDATSNLDRHDTKLFHFICPSPVGGLPLGRILTSREDENTISAAIELFKSVLPHNAFFGRGPDLGPKIIMTDDATGERNALSKQWPHVILLLCVFHLLQAFWRWLWDSDHRIEKTDRPTIFNQFKAVVYAPNDEEYEKAENDVLNHSSVTKYPLVVAHMKNDILPRKEEWSLSTRFERNYATHNVNTTSYAEVSFRITKENRFNRIKAYNLADLLTMVLDDSEHYVQRCIDIGNNRLSELKNQKSRYFHRTTSINSDAIVATEDGLPNSYIVPSERTSGKFYEVNMDLGLCECPIGMLRGPCKHKQLVAAKFDIVTSDTIPSSDSHSDSQLRGFYHFLATGVHKSNDWYRPLVLPLEDDLNNEFNCTKIFDFMKLKSDTLNKTHDTHDSGNSLPAPNVYDSDGDAIISGNESLENVSKAELISEFKSCMEDFSHDISHMIENCEDVEYFRKPIKRFMKNLDAARRSNAPTIVKALYAFGNEINFSMRRGKSGRKIKINNTNKARRVFKIRGSCAAPKGRPTKTVKRNKRKSEINMCVLPVKKRKKKNPHSLSKSVAANRAAEKKH